MLAALKDLINKVAPSDRGTAIVTVIGALAATSIFGFAVTTSVTVNSRHSSRDLNVKLALGAAEGGMQEATYRMNMLQPTQSNPCVTKIGDQLELAPAPGPEQWCNEEILDLGSGVSAVYQISPYVNTEGTVTRSIVSTGTSNGVYRRVHTTASANLGEPLFSSPYALSSDKVLNVWGIDINVTGSVRSNKNISLSGSWFGDVTICGDPGSATPGPDYSVSMNSYASVCGSTAPASEEFTLTPVDQGDAPTNNDNDRFFSQDPKTGTVDWNAETRELSIGRVWGSSSLTLTGHTYSLCKLTLWGNSPKLIIDASSEVRIFIDSPDNCPGLSSWENQLNMIGFGVQIVNSSEDPAHMQIYMLGEPSESRDLAVIAFGGINTHMSLYAPNTDLKIVGIGGSFSGAMSARSILTAGWGLTMDYDPQVEQITEPTTGVYTHQTFIECTAVNTGSSPDDSC